MVCAGFVFLQVEETPGGDAAKEGTAFGEMLERMLTNKPVGMSASNGIYFDDDMKFYGQPLYDDIMSRAATPVLCEQRIDWQTQSGIWIRGSYDVSFINHEDHLCLEDFKYGWGIVEVKENWQLLGYAIGEVIRRGRSFDKIHLTVHQPRPHHEDGSSRTWTLTYPELLEYKDKIEARMSEIANGRNDFQTSKNCKYCPGTAEACPAFSRLFYRALEVSTEFVQDSLTEEEIARQLDQIKRSEEVLKIKADSLVELGVSRIKNGKIIPGYVQTTKYGHRSWNKGITPDALKLMTGREVTEKVLMSPAKVEKMGIPKTIIDQLSSAHMTGMKLEKKNGSDVGNKIFGNTNPTGGN